MAAGQRLESPEYWQGLIGRSLSRYLLLDMLAQRPMHGYEIARSIEACCEDWCAPTDGMIYPTIKELVAGGYVECTPETTGGRVRKVCRLTDRGRAAHRAAVRQPVQTVREARESGARVQLEGAGERDERGARLTDPFTRPC